MEGQIKEYFVLDVMFKSVSVLLVFSGILLVVILEEIEFFDFLNELSCCVGN